MKKFKDIKVGDILYSYNSSLMSVSQLTIENMEYFSDGDLTIWFKYKGERSVRHTDIHEKDLKKHASSSNILGGCLVTPNFEIIEKFIEEKIKTIQESFKEIKKMKPRKDKIKTILDDETV